MQRQQNNYIKRAKMIVASQSLFNVINENYPYSLGEWNIQTILNSNGFEYLDASQLRMVEVLLRSNNALLKSLTDFVGVSTDYISVNNPKIEHWFRTFDTSSLTPKSAKLNADAEILHFIRKDILTYLQLTFIDQLEDIHISNNVPTFQYDKDARIELVPYIIKEMDKMKIDLGLTNHGYDNFIVMGPVMLTEMFKNYSYNSSNLHYYSTSAIDWSDGAFVKTGYYGEVKLFSFFDRDKSNPRSFIIYNDPDNPSLIYAPKVGQFSNVTGGPTYVGELRISGSDINYDDFIFTNENSSKSLRMFYAGDLH